MKDPDEMMAYEAKQQELLDSIVRSLHEATRDDDTEDGHVHVFLAVGLNAVHFAYEGTTIAPNYNGPAFFDELVRVSIEAFTETLEEREALLMRIGLRLLEAPHARLEGRYRRQQLDAELEPAP